LARSTRQKVRELLADGKGVNQIARELGLHRSTVCYHKQRLGFSMDQRCRLRYDWADVQRYYDEGHSIRECCLYFGFSSASWHEAVKRGAIASRPIGMPLERLLVANTPRGRWNIKQRLISTGLKAKCCEKCGIAEWRDTELPLSLHHVNGNGLDNRLENLQLLCPNCHSQTPNFGSKNKRPVAA
jgi:HNH endonuclease